MSVKTRFKASAIESRNTVAPTLTRTMAGAIAGRSPQRTDVIYPEFLLFIEGVQVPFLEMSITETFGQLPEAVISIPPFSGLQEIGRNYNPKVHIFFKDTEAERHLLESGVKFTLKDVLRLKFSGTIRRASYHKETNGMSASTSITFFCAHKYAVLDEVFVKFGSRGIEASMDGPVDGVAAQSAYLGSRQMVLQALKPISSPFRRDVGSIDAAEYQQSVDSYVEKTIAAGTAPESTPDISIVPRYLGKYPERVLGVPGYVVSVWNSLRRDAHMFYEVADVMTKMYIPVVEQGLRFLQRTSGHFFLENQLQSEGVTAEPVPVQSASGEEETIKAVLPPGLNNGIGRAVSVSMAVESMQSALSYSGEQASLSDIIESMIGVLQYDRLTLSSPVQSSEQDAEAVDTILKPVMPLYFSPTCNVILPSMYNSLNINDAYDDTPTRMYALHELPFIQDNPLDLMHFRAPHPYRAAVSEMRSKSTKEFLNLNGTLALFAEAVASHEEGRGVRPRKSRINMWMQFLNMDSLANTPTSGDPISNEEFVKIMAEDWFQRNRPQWGTAELASANEASDRKKLDPLNPWKPQSVNGIEEFKRNIFLSLEYEYALSILQARTGQVTMGFNPFIVAGYPCDIIGKNFSEPSYHAFVTSVATHVSGSGRVQTTATFTSAMTYEELDKYALPAALPWMTKALALVKNPSLTDPEVNNDAHRAATEYYMNALGVGFANPRALYDFDTRRGKLPILDAVSGSMLQGVPWPSSGTRRFGSNLEESLILTRREIESMADIEQMSAQPMADPDTGTASLSGVGFVPNPGLRFILMSGVESQVNTRTITSAMASTSYSSVQSYFQKTVQLGKSAFLKYSDDPDYSETDVTCLRPSQARQLEELLAKYSTDPATGRTIPWTDEDQKLVTKLLNDMSSRRNS